ncbi:MAG: PQQ-binding-like beta-propeller repeat protein [Planctomycetaceae bacterium]|nr:PQQ-binding-like beta-propeller repeat protein [Planctomycetaceae bacterium]
MRSTSIDTAGAGIGPARSTHLLAAATWFCMAGSATLPAADWPQFRGPSGQGTSAETQLPVEWGTASNVVWQVELPGPGGSSPVIFGDRILLTCYRGYGEPGGSGDMSRLERLLVCLNRQDGRELWKTPTPAKLPEQDRIRDEHGYATSTPAVDKDRIYVFYGKSGVHAFSPAGKPLWNADVGDGLNGWGSASSPVLYRDLVFINASVESESLVALDRATGQERWRARDIKESWNTPVLVSTADGGTELVVAVFGKILGFDPLKGTQLWSCNTDIPWYMVPGVVAHEGVIYCIGGRSGGALAVRAGGKGDVTASHRLWVGKKGSNVSSPVFVHGRLFWTHEQLGIAYCADAKTGELLYEERLPRGGQFYPSAVFGDGKLYYTSRTGKTFVVAAKPQFELLAVNDLDDRSHFHASPAIADGRIYIRSDRRLYCVGE